jgi:hypothetical protein
MRSAFEFCLLTAAKAVPSGYGAGVLMGRPQRSIALQGIAPWYGLVKISLKKEINCGGGL